MQWMRVLTMNLVNRFILRNKRVAYSVASGEVIYLNHAHDTVLDVLTASLLLADHSIKALPVSLDVNEIRNVKKSL